MRRRREGPGLCGGVAILSLVLGASGCAGWPASLGASSAPEPAPQIRLPEVVSAPGTPRVLVVVSMAGLTSDHTKAEGGMPVLSALASAGVVARHVESVVPASPYAIHATLVTGREPAQHGVLGDRLIEDAGLSRTRPWDVAHLRVPTLWDAVQRAGRPVVSLDWPTTRGAGIAAVMPDGEPVERDQQWIASIADATSPWLLAMAQAAGPAIARSGAERDAFLVSAACVAIADVNPPGLLMLRLRGAEGPLRQRGPGGAVAEGAFGALDQQVARLLVCLASSPVAQGSEGLDAALVVVGDRAFQPVHTAVRPNRILAEEGLASAGGGPWRALLRTHGGSADLYAQNADDAVAARGVLAEASRDTGGFRIVSAEERIARGADPEAWLGLEAAPGFVLLDGSRGPALSPAPGRGAAGYLQPGQVSPGFVAWGRGFRRELIVSTLHQLDVAPTLARLLEVELPDAQGRRLIGLLRVTGPVAASPVDEFEE